MKLFFTTPTGLHFSGADRADKNRRRLAKKDAAKKKKPALLAKVTSPAAAADSAPQDVATVVRIKPILTPRRGAEMSNELTNSIAFLGGTPHTTGFARNATLFWDVARNFRQRFPVGNAKPTPIFVAGGADMREVAELGLCLAAQEPSFSLERMSQQYPVTAVEKNVSLVERAGQGVFELRMPEKHGIAQLLKQGGEPLKRLWQEHLRPVQVQDAENPSAPVPVIGIPANHPLSSLMLAMLNSKAPQYRGDQLLLLPHGDGLQASAPLKKFMGDIRQGDMFDLEQHMPKGTGLVLLRNAVQYHPQLAAEYLKRVAERMSPNGLMCLGDSDLSAISPQDAHVERIRQGLLAAGLRPLSRGDCVYNYEDPRCEQFAVPVVYEKPV